VASDMMGSGSILIWNWSGRKRRFIWIRVKRVQSQVPI